jgi:transposase
METCSLANQVRGFLREFGITVGQGIRVLRRCLPQILEDGGNEIEPTGRTLLAELREELVELNERVSALDARLSAQAQAYERCRRLQSVPGVGPLIATALSLQSATRTVLAVVVIWQRGSV